MIEKRVSEERILIADRSDRGKLRLTGPQALWFLDQLFTNQMEGLDTGHGCETLLLNPRGRIQAHGRVFNLGDEVYVDYEPRAASLFDFLSSRIFTTQVEIEDVSDIYRILDVIGTSADELLRTAHPEIDLPSRNEFDLSTWNGAPVVRLIRPSPGISVWTDDDATPLTELGAEPASDAELEGIRVADGYPLIGQDFDESFLPQEAALERTVHFSKGCYLGQEAVAMAQRGSVKRKLRRVAFDGSPVKGEVRHGGTPVGRVTSVGTAGGRGLGIAVLSTAVTLGSTVEVISGSSIGAATVEELPGAPSGPEVPSARDLRERLQKR